MYEQLWGTVEERYEGAVSDTNMNGFSEIGDEHFWRQDDLEQRIRQRLSQFAAEFSRARRLREDR